MDGSGDLGEGFDSFHEEGEEAAPVKNVKAEDILVDLRAGMRTKDFLTKYGLSLSEFEDLIKQLLRKGIFGKDEFKAWKARKPVQPPPPKPQAPAKPQAPPKPPVESKTVDTKPGDHVETFIINDPERNHSWALQLFSIKRESMRGAKFKVNLHGKKYAFVVEELLFRGPVSMHPTAMPRKSAPAQDKREDAIKFISQHGWAAYLESRAFEANFGISSMEAAKKARLVLLLCRNNTFLAALHTPAPAVNLYVGGSLDTVMGRLSKSVDTREIKI